MERDLTRDYTQDDGKALPRLRKATFMLFCLCLLIEVEVNAGKVLYLLNDKLILLEYSTLSLSTLYPVQHAVG